MTKNGDTVAPLVPKFLSDEERNHAFYLWNDEILDSFTPEEYTAVLAYVLELEHRLGMTSDEFGRKQT
jgi:hypothetical protein